MNTRTGFRADPDSAVHEFGIGDGDEVVTQAEALPDRGSKSRRKKVRKRRGLRTPELINKLERRARGGDIVSYDDGVPCVPVRVDELLAVLEWVQESEQKVEDERANHRQVLGDLRNRMLNNNGSNP